MQRFPSEKCRKFRCRFDVDYMREMCIDVCRMYSTSSFLTWLVLVLKGWCLVCDFFYYSVYFVFVLEDYSIIMVVEYFMLSVNSS